MTAFAPNLLDQGHALDTGMMSNPVIFALVAGDGKDSSLVIAKDGAPDEFDRFLMEHVDFTVLRGNAGQRWGLAYYDEINSEPVVEGNSREGKQQALDALYAFMESGVEIMDTIGRPSCPEEPRLVRPVRKAYRRWLVGSLRRS